MLKATGIALVVLAGVAMPASAEVPNLAGSWTCDAAPMVIRDQWTTLTYTIDVAEQKEALFTGEMTWVLPKDKGAEGNQGGESSYSGTIKFLGVVDFDDTTFEIVAYGDGHRHQGTLVDADTFRLVSSETGDNAWVSRSVCHRDPS